MRKLRKTNLMKERLQHLKREDEKGKEKDDKVQARNCQRSSTEKEGFMFAE